MKNERPSNLLIGVFVLIFSVFFFFAVGALFLHLLKPSSDDPAANGASEPELLNP